MTGQFRSNRRCAQRGSVAIEFAVLFMVFFTVFYATVCYSLAMLLKQGFTQAAEEGARAVIAIDPLAFDSTADYQSAVTTAAVARASAALVWLPARAKAVVVDGGHVTATMAGDVVTVTVAYPNYASDPMIPVLRVPGIGDVPALPADLAGTAVLQL